MKKNSFIKIFYLILPFAFFNCASAQIKKKTAKQINALQKEKAARTAIQNKIESNLLQAIRQSKGEKPVAGIVVNPADVNADASGFLNVDISANVTDSLLQEIKNLGGEIIFPSKEYHTIRAKVALSKVETIASYPEVTFIQPAVLAQNNRMSQPIKQKD